MAGFSESASVWLSGFTALAQVVGIAISIRLVDLLGRRTLVLYSLGAVALSLAGLGASFWWARVTSEPMIQSYSHCKFLEPSLIWDGRTRFCYDCLLLDGCGVCGSHCVPETGIADLCFNANEWSNSHCPNTSHNWLSVICMVLYLLAFGVGMGGLPWTIHSEIYPLVHRSLAMSCSTAANWIGNLVVAATFLTLAEPGVLATYGAFWMYGIVAFVGWMWLYFCLPETKGLSLEQIERLFQDNSNGYDQVGMDEYDEDYDSDEDYSDESEGEEEEEGEATSETVS